MATVLGLVLVLGVVWLVRSATTGSESTAGVDRTTDSADPSNDTDGTADSTTHSTADSTIDSDGDGTPDSRTTRSGAASDSTATDGGGTPQGGRTPKGRRPSVELNGVNLQGSGNSEGCVTVINKTATPAVIESVSFVITGGPARPAVHSDNGDHCYRAEGDDRDTPCLGLLLVEGRQCLTGAVLAPGARAGEYTVQAVVHSSFLCDNDKIDPCNYVTDWGGPPPTPQAPVRVRSSGTGKALRSTIVVGGTSPPPPGDSSPPDTSQGEEEGDEG